MTEDPFQSDGRNPLLSPGALARLRNSMEELATMRGASQSSSASRRSAPSRDPHILAERFRFLDEGEHQARDIERSSARGESLFEEIGDHVRHAASLSGRAAVEYWSSVATAFRGLNAAAERRFSTPLGNLTPDRRRLLASTLMDVARVTMTTDESAGRAIAVVALWMEAQGLVPLPRVKASSAMAGTLIESCLESLG